MPSQLDLSIFEKFDFEYPPVGVKFLMARPADMERLGRQAAFCEMLSIAQTSDPFYAAADDHECKGGQILLGMADPDPVFESGQMGVKLKVYEEPRANRRIYDQAAKLARGAVNYIAFSPLRKLTFQPDLLILTAKPSQAEIVLRAAGYRTGAGWNAKGTTVLGCSWLYLYPYIHGELNLMVTGLHHGMKARRLFPEGLLLLSLPFDVLPDIVESLKTMEWDLPQYHWGKDVHHQKMREFAEEARRELNA